MYVDLPVGDDGNDCIHSGLGPAVENTVNTVDLHVGIPTGNNNSLVHSFARTFDLRVFRVETRVELLSRYLEHLRQYMYQVR